MSKNFEELLKALAETEDQAAADLAKAEAAAEDEDDGEDEDDEMIAAAAADAEGDGDADAAGAGAADFGKSFEFTDENGEKHQAVDATELVKSLLERQDVTETTLAKAMESMAGALQKQGDLIKSLTSQVQKLSSQGRGRKSLVSVAEKPDAGALTKSEQPGFSPDEFFAKANAAFDAGKITGKELTTIDVCRRGNYSIDPALISKVLSA